MVTEGPVGDRDRIRLCLDVCTLHFALDDANSSTLSVTYDCAVIRANNHR